MRKPMFIWILVSVFLIANILIFFYLLRGNNYDILKVYFLDIGQGDSIFIEAPNGRQVLVDSGKPGTIMSKLGEVMPIGDKSIDIIVGTHPDQDHIGGLSDVISNYKIGAILEPGSNTDSKTYAKLEQDIENQNLTRILAKTGMKIILDQKRNIYLEILFPDQDVSSWETNASSVVMKLSYDGESFLLTGDSPIAIERYLISKIGENLYSSVLKLGHHGSRTSSSLEFLKIVSPKYAVVSAGLNNTYGHPHKEVLDILSALRIPYVNTAKEGTILFETDGESLKVK